MTALRTSLACLALVGLAGCDFALFPETAQYDDAEVARAAVSFGADGMSSTMDNVKVEVTDVLLHRPEDDAWLLLGDNATVVNLAHPERGVTYKNVPLALTEYDQVTILIGDVEVQEDGEWTYADVPEQEVEIRGDFAVEGDVVVDLRFDVQASLRRDPRAGWIFEPAVSVSLLRSE